MHLAKKDVRFAEANLQRKLGDRTRALARAKQKSDEIAMRSGSYMVGRNADGEAVHTQTPDSLNIKVSGWFVRTLFRKDDTKRLEGTAWREVEMMVKERAVPKMVVVHGNHIITATRGLKHACESYERSMESDIPVIRDLYKLNEGINRKGGSASNEDIDAHIRSLEGFRKRFTDARSALFHFVGRGRLEEAIQKFTLARDGPPNKRAFAISSACAVLNSVPERLTKWKDGERPNRFMRTRRRECSLRVERDRWLLAQFAKFATNPGRELKFVKMDLEKRESMEVLRQKIEAACKLEKDLRKLKRKKDNSVEHLRLIKEKYAELKKAVSDAHRYFHAKKGLCTEDGKKPAFLLAHHSWIDRYLLNYKFEKALDKTDYFMLLLDSNKPRFILDELSKDPDPYLEKAVLPGLKLAVEAMEAEDFKNAGGNFVFAMKKMRDIVYPQVGRNENKNSVSGPHNGQEGRYR
ncbi:hypothetical protein H0O00_04485 [Candidatus Micrarchaeota archaeon]|nr:hypothetical protein [Candidatus Micrarchaeota archaeon]